MFNYDNQDNTKFVKRQSWAHCDVTQLITAKTVERQVTLSEVRNFKIINPTNLVFFRNCASKDQMSILTKHNFLTGGTLQL